MPQLPGKHRPCLILVTPVFNPEVHQLLTPVPIHCLFTAYSLPIYCLFTTYTLPKHCIFTAYSLPIHCLVIVYSLTEPLTASPLASDYLVLLRKLRAGELLPSVATPANVPLPASPIR
jgi:hypothetical protein